MYLSRKGLSVASLVKADSDIPGLDNVHVREDGSTVGSNGVTCMLVSPVRTEVKKILKGILKDRECGSVTLTSDTVKEVLKGLPIDKKFGGMTEHCCLESDGSGDVEIHSTDGTRKSSIKGKVYRRPYIDYTVFLQSLRERGGKRVVVNLPRLLLLLQVIDKIIKTGDEENAVFIEFADNGSIILRGVDKVTGQRVLAVMNQYDNEEQNWLKPDEWEESLVPKSKVRHKRK